MQCSALSWPRLLLVATLSVLLPSPGLCQATVSPIPLGSIEEERPAKSVICHLPSTLQRHGVAPIPSSSSAPSQMLIQFHEQRSQVERLFQIDRDTQDFVTNRVINLESLCEVEQLCCDMKDTVGESCVINFVLRIAAKGGPSADLHLQRVSVTIVDINDHAPTFPSRSIEKMLNENLPPMYTIALPLAEDKDRGRHGIVQYVLSEATRVTSSTSNSLSVRDAFSLQVERKSDNSERIIGLNLISKKSFDRESVAEIHMQIVARDGGGKTDVMDVVVKIVDENDCVPQFVNLSRVVHLAENTPMHRTVLEISATDCDEGENGRVSYFMKNVSPVVSGVFSLDADSGRLIVSGSVDRESVSRYEVQLIIRDNGNGRALSAREMIVINVTDTNDNAPKIHSPLRGFRVKENSPANTLLGTLDVTDADSGANGQFHCHLSTHLESFHLVEFEGVEGVFKLLTARSAVFDREQKDMYEVRMKCVDQGSPIQLTATEVIRVSLEDENDNPPVFTMSEFTFTIAENQPPATRVGRIVATDADLGLFGELSYIFEESSAQFSLVSEYLALDARSGEIRTKVLLDHETVSQISGHVTAVDSGNGANSLRTTVPFSVQITDENDNDPVFKCSNPLSIQVREDAPISHTVARVYATDTDSGANGDVTYELLTETATFKISPRSGDLQLRSGLDREQRQRYEVLVRASDKGSSRRRSATLMVDVEVTDINDCAPEFIVPPSRPLHLSHFTVNISSRATPGLVVLKVLANDCDEGDNARLQYFLVPQNSSSLPADYLQVVQETFILQEFTGELRLARSPHPKLTSYVLKVMARDMGSPSKNTTQLLILRVVEDDSLFASMSGGDLPYRHLPTYTALVTHSVLIVVGGLAILVVLVLLGVISLLLHRRWLHMREAARSGRDPNGRFVATDVSSRKSKVQGDKSVGLESKYMNISRTLPFHGQPFYSNDLNNPPPTSSTLNALPVDEYNTLLRCFGNDSNNTVAMGKFYHLTGARSEDPHRYHVSQDELNHSTTPAHDKYGQHFAEASDPAYTCFPVSQSSDSMARSSSFGALHHAHLDAASAPIASNCKNNTSPQNDRQEAPGGEHELLASGSSTVPSNRFKMDNNRARTVNLWQFPSSTGGPGQYGSLLTSQHRQATPKTLRKLASAAPPYDSISHV